MACWHRGADPEPGKRASAENHQSHSSPQPGLIVSVDSARFTRSEIPVRFIGRLQRVGTKESAPLRVAVVEEENETPICELLRG